MFSEKEVRRYVRERLRQRFNEGADKADEPKSGKQSVDVEGNIDVNKIAKTLGVDASKLATSVKAAKKGKRNASVDAVLADVFVKLMNANPKDTTTVMNVLKKIQAEEKD